MSVQNSHQISDIKVLLKIGANGNGIVSVEKTGTVGNVDTYTITFSDGTTTNFDLTNGTSIDTIEKTDTQGLVDTYTITLTDGSTTTFEVVNGTTSADVSAIVNVYGSKNLNSYPYFHTTRTVNGITFTDNGDGTISESGTGTSAQSNAAFTFHSTTTPLYLKNGTYTLSGCPEGGSETSFYLRAWWRKPDNSEDIFVYDYGEGVTFEIDGSYGDADGAIVNLQALTIGTTAISGTITYKPMIRDARISDDTYVPYAMTNKQITEQKADINKTIATKEGATASQNYTIGDKIVDSSGYLGVVIASVSQGATWTLDTNYKRILNDASVTLVTISDTTKKWNEVLSSLWSTISSINSSRRRKLALLFGNLVCTVASSAYSTNIFFTSTYLGSTTGSLEVYSFMAGESSPRAWKNQDGTKTDFSTETIGNTVSLILFL